MSRLTLIKRRSAAGGAAAAGFIASVIQAGISFVSRFVLVATEVNPAVSVTADRLSVRGPTQILASATSLLGADGLASVTQIPAVTADASLRSQTGTEQTPAFAVAQREEVAWSGTQPTPAFDIDLLGVGGTAASEVHTPAVAVSPRISEYHRDAAPSFEMQQVVYTLTRRVGGNAQAAVGTAWTTPANAVGDRDGAVATCAGSALSATKGIELNYANSAGKGELAITAATLYLYGDVTGDATGLLSTYVVSYNIGAGLVTLETIAGNFSNLVTPRPYSLPLLDTWAEYDALAARVVSTLGAASVGVTARLDAIEIEIVANKTDAL